MKGLSKIFTLFFTLSIMFSGVSFSMGGGKRASTKLTTQEKEDLIYMREEEKLARDVYITLYEKWGHNTFANIKDSEEEHTSSIKRLLDKYNLADPVKDNTVGVFTNPKFEKLYQELTYRGETSLVEGLKVGGYIEEVDMVDIKEKNERTNKRDISRVYSNLLDGSKNHLRAFARALESLGEDYEAQVISQEEVDTILE